MIVPMLALLFIAAPITVDVFVPLCDSAIIDCGNTRLGDPASLTTNLYWGAGYGAATWLRKQPGYVRTSDVPGSKPEILREQTFERRAGPGERVVQVRLRAYHGSQIDVALADYFAAVAGGSNADVVLWMGHDRLMDVPAPALSKGSAPKKAIVLACASKQYFAPALATIGAEPLLMTRSLMAPEAYLLVAVIDTLARRGGKQDLRRAAIAAYAKYQKITEKAASSVFAPVE